MDKQKLQGERPREEILDVASWMMSTRGFEGTSVADIARELGLPNSLIYWHFNSRAGILAAVMERGAERFFEAAGLTDPPEAHSPATSSFGPLTGPVTRSPPTRSSSGSLSSCC